MGLNRVRMVWISFLGAMTAVGGLLLMLDDKSPRLDGMTVSPLALASTIGTPVDPIRNTRKPLDRQRWQAIIIHHSSSLAGSPSTIAKEHEARGLKGLGYHFVIGNGHGMDDGELHIGFRWFDQVPGAHTGGANGDFYNRHAVSICLVGDGNRRVFTPAQIERLTALVESLRKQLDLPADRVILASDVSDAQSPGRLFPTYLFKPATP